ncbi:hypothetical protein ACI65C_000333 [Semiaphis heraclei]
MFPDRTTPARYNASGKAMLRAAMPGADDDDAAEDRVPAGPQVVVLPAVQRVHVSRRTADRAPMAVLRVPVHAQAARRARGARLPKQRAQEGTEAAGQTGVRGNLHTCNLKSYRVPIYTIEFEDTNNNNNYMMCMIFTMLYLLIYKYMTNVGTVLEIVWKGFYSGCGEGLTAKIMFWEKTTCLEYLETQILNNVDIIIIPLCQCFLSVAAMHFARAKYYKYILVIILSVDTPMCQNILCCRFFVSQKLE